MSKQTLTHEPTLRIADRMAAARQGRLVGRLAERELFRSALLADDPPFVVLYLHGPGGVGKSTLLREYARVAVECGRDAVLVDGRTIEPSPAGFLCAVEEAGEASSVLLIDTYEMLAPLDSWLRDTYLPQLPAHTLVVIAGRNTPPAGWTVDLDWAALTKVVSVGNLLPDESRTYLATRGVADEWHLEALSLTHGHPLALTLIADVLNRRDTLDGVSLGREPDLVRVLLDRLVEEVPSERFREALELCTLVWATTEGLLTRLLGETDVRDVFEWLRGLSFIEHGAYGLFPHDVAREALYADLRWRNPDRLRQLIQQLSAYFHDRFQQARGDEQQRIWFDVLHLTRHHPFMRQYFEWEALGSAFAEPATEADQPAILAMVRRHQGDESARIASYWLSRQPEGFLAYRDGCGDLIGFMAQLSLDDMTEDDARNDPAIAAATAFVNRHGPTRPGEESVYLRFWMSRDLHQGVSAAVNLTAINSSIYWMTHPELAWNFIAIAEPDDFEPRFTSIQLWRSPEADFVVGGHRYGVFSHDWRAEPQRDWFGVKMNLAIVPDVQRQRHVTRPAAPLLVLSREAFNDAVRQALRDYCRPDLLARNPLSRTRLVGEATEDVAVAARLQELMLMAVGSLAGNPKDTKFRRAIWHTYIEPAPTQELAAELLDIPFNTFRYRLAKGIERVTDWLWQRELQHVGQ